MKHQLAALLLVIGDQSPSVNAKAGVGQIEVINGLSRQLLQPAAEVVTQVANQSADERERIIGRRLAFAEVCKALAQALQESVGRFVRRRRQLCQWPGTDKVIASTLRYRSSRIQ